MDWHFWGHVAQCEQLNLKVSEAVSPSGADVRGPVGLTAVSPSTARTSASHVAAPRTVLNISCVSCHEKKLFHIILYVNTLIYICIHHSSRPAQHICCTLSEDSLLLEEQGIAVGVVIDRGSGECPQFCLHSCQSGRAICVPYGAVHFRRFQLDNE